MATPRDLTGQVVDRRYRVEYQLGRGGMGAVWSVQHVESLRHFALKTLESELAGSAEARDRLLRETRAAGALRSAHVVQVVDSQMDYVHEGEPLPYLVMERLDGFTLEHWVGTRGPLDPGELVWVLRQIGRALGLAHGHGIIHRDIKPSNIFLSLDDEGKLVAKLCDFGIAKLTSSAATKLLTGGGTTATGSVLGTPLYLAPELLRGSERATPATDQWALGLTAFNALTGRDYFGDATSGTELVLKIAQDPLPLPSSLDRRLGARFDAWFMRSCARAPEKRFASVAEQVDALGPALGDPRPEPPLAVGSARPQADATISTAPKPAPAERTQLRRAMWAFSALWAIAGVLFLLAFRPGKPEKIPSDSQSASAGRTLPSPELVAAPAPALGVAPDVYPAPAGQPVASSEEPAATPQSKAKAVAHQPVKARPSRPPAVERPATGTRLASGSPCRRSAQCASGLCVAEQCR